MRFLPPYTSSEVAAMLGISVDTLYRTRELRHDRDGLPRPLSGGRMKWERTGFDAWLTRFHPDRPSVPSSGSGSAPMSIEEHRADLHAYYARRRSESEASSGYVPPDPEADEEHRRRLHEAYGSYSAGPAKGRGKR